MKSSAASRRRRTGALGVVVVACVAASAAYGGGPGSDTSLPAKWGALRAERASTQRTPVPAADAPPADVDVGVTADPMRAPDRIVGDSSQTRGTVGIFYTYLGHQRFGFVPWE
jgi:hypothetical protein